MSRGGGTRGAVGVGESVRTPIEVTIRLLLRYPLAGRDDAVLMAGVVLVSRLLDTTRHRW